MLLSPIDMASWIQINTCGEAKVSPKQWLLTVVRHHIPTHVGVWWLVVSEATRG